MKNSLITRNKAITTTLIILILTFMFEPISLTTTSAIVDTHTYRYENRELDRKNRIYGDFMSDLYLIFTGERIDFNTLPTDSVQKYLDGFSDMYPRGIPFEDLDKVKVSSQFGWRRNPNTGKPQFHKGIDIKAPLHRNVHSTMKGTVITVVYTTKKTYGKGYGNYVVIKNPIGFQTLYSHLSAIYVKKGQKVDKGELIGTVGITGNATGPNLHYEIHQAGDLKNPLDSLFMNWTH